VGEPAGELEVGSAGSTAEAIGKAGAGSVGAALAFSCSPPQAVITSVAIAAAVHHLVVRAMASV
jgi:hypothetical protein